MVIFGRRVSAQPLSPAAIRGRLPCPPLSPLGQGKRWGRFLSKRFSPRQSRAGTFQTEEETRMLRVCALLARGAAPPPRQPAPPCPQDKTRPVAFRLEA